MSYVPRKFQKYTTFYYYLFLLFCRHFFVYTTNFLDSWDTILDRTIQIQFTYLQKKDSGYVLYFVEVVFSNKFLNTGRYTNMPKDVNWLDDAQNKKSKWNEISWSIDLICFLQFTKLKMRGFGLSNYPIWKIIVGMLEFWRI